MGLIWLNCFCFWYPLWIFLICQFWPHCWAGKTNHQPVVHFIQDYVRLDAILFISHQKDSNMMSQMKDLIQELGRLLQASDSVQSRARLSITGLGKNVLKHCVGNGFELSGQTLQSDCSWALSRSGTIIHRRMATRSAEGQQGFLV